MAHSKQNNNASKSDENPKEKPGELHRDMARDDRGPTYEGADWEHALEAGEQKRVPHDESASAERDQEIDETVSDPGTRGAVYGKGGKGIVQRDQEPNDEQPRTEEEQLDQTRGVHQPPNKS